MVRLLVMSNRRHGAIEERRGPVGCSGDETEMSQEAKFPMDRDYLL